MTNPQHEALVEAVARAICANNVRYVGPKDDRDFEQRVSEEWEGWVQDAQAAIAALSATAATPSDEEVRLRGKLAALHYECLSFARHEGSPFDLAMTRAEAEFGNLRARAALEPQAKDMC